MRYAAPLTALLCFAILTIWITAGWAWAVFQVGVFALAAAWSIGRKSRLSLLMLPVAAPLLAGIAQIAAHRTIYAWATWTSSLTWAAWLALLFLALQIFQDADIRRRTMRALAICGGLLSIAAIVQMYASPGRIFGLFDSGYDSLVMGPFTNRDQFAAFIELLLPIALAESLHDRRRWLAWCAVAAAMAASVIASGSRAGAVIVMLEIVAVPSIAWLRGRASAKIVGALVALAVVFSVVAGWDLLWRHLHDRDPFAGRREMLVSSIHMIEERPWTGFGLGTWAIVYPRFALYDDGTYVNQAHNDWAQWAAEGGIPMAAILLALAIGLVRPAFRSIWGLGVPAVLAHALVDFPFQQRPAVGAWFFAIAGALAARGGGRQTLE